MFLKIVETLAYFVPISFLITKRTSPALQAAFSLLENRAQKIADSLFKQKHPFLSSSPPMLTQYQETAWGHSWRSVGLGAVHPLPVINWPDAPGAKTEVACARRPAWGRSIS